MPVLLLIALLTSAVTTTDRATVIAAVKTKLKDPDSARFKGLKQTSPHNFCGWVNARNSYGGYSGFAVFYVTPKGVALLTPEVSEPGLC